MLLLSVFLEMDCDAEDIGFAIYANLILYEFVSMYVEIFYGSI